MCRREELPRLQRLGSERPVERRGRGTRATITRKSARASRMMGVLFKDFYDLLQVIVVAIDVILIRKRER